MKGEQMKSLSEILPPKKLEEIINQMTMEFQRYVEFHDECVIQYKDEIESLKQEIEVLENHVETLNDIVGMYEQESEDY